jgi:hypothetical protein
MGKAMSTVTITIETANGGSQERDYGPHVTDAKVTISTPVGMFPSYFTSRGYAENVVRALVGSYCDESTDAHKQGGANDYFSPHLKAFEEVQRINGTDESVTWHVRIESPFTD